MNTLNCPSCHQAMTSANFPRTLGGELALDLCFSCQGIWFDEFESAQITPGGIIELFRRIQEQRDTPHLPLSATLHCPRCEDRLLHGLDVSKFGGQFNYYRCLQKHGRFVNFSQYLIEKGFVRQLNPSEIQTLAAKVGSIRCSGCGAAVDIGKESACPHCRSPIAILDPVAVEAALARYGQAEAKRGQFNVEALGEAIVLRAREESRLEREKRTRSVDNLDLGDLIEAGIDLIFSIAHH